MKNVFMKPIVGTFLGILLLFGCAANSAFGQSEKSFNDGFGPGIQGVWQTTVTQRVCGTGVAIRTFKGLVTFNDSGTISETSAALSPAFRSPGHGLWERQGSKTYYGAFTFLVFNPDGTFAGTQKIKQTYQLSRFGDTYTSNGFVELSDANGNLILSGCATSSATRFDPH